MDRKKPMMIVANYCVGFVDLLGQRAAYRNEGLLPNMETESDKMMFIKKIKETIKPIYNLQKDAERFLSSALSYEGPIRKSLSPEQKAVFDEMGEVDLKQQRWSDGLVYYVTLLGGNVKCPTSSIYHLFGTVGVLCFMGLAKKRPIRGAIDIAWGVELREGELYGAVIANAYELESKVAKYPRIVISDRTYEYFMSCIRSPAPDQYAEFNQQMAKICINMMKEDFDGNYILDYLGIGFRETITKKRHNAIYEYALKYVHEQLGLWKERKNTVLSMRYNHLYSYFMSNQPNDKESL